MRREWKVMYDLQLVMVRISAWPAGVHGGHEDRHERAEACAGEIEHCWVMVQYNFN